MRRAPTPGHHFSSRLILIQSNECNLEGTNIEKVIFKQHLHLVEPFDYLHVSIMVAGAHTGAVLMLKNPRGS